MNILRSYDDYVVLMDPVCPLAFGTFLDELDAVLRFLEHRVHLGEQDVGVWQVEVTDGDLEADTGVRLFVRLDAACKSSETVSSRGIRQFFSSCRMDRLGFSTSPPPRIMFLIKICCLMFG